MIPAAVHIASTLRRNHFISRAHGILALALALNLALALTLPATAQVYQSNPAFGHQFLRFRSSIALTPPYFTDSASLPRLPIAYAGISRTDSTTGSLAYTRTDSTLWYYTGTQWRRLSGTSSGSSIGYPLSPGRYLNGYGNFPTLNTDSITEGSTNLFYTPARARSAISLTTTGTSGAATYNASTGVLNVPGYTLAGLGGFANPMTTTGDLILATTGGTPTRLGIGANGTVLTSSGTTASWQPASSGGTPGGSNTQIQYNNAGAFAGSASLTWNNSTNSMLINGVITHGTQGEGVKHYYRELGAGNNTGIAMDASANLNFFIPTARFISFGGGGGPFNTEWLRLSSSLLTLSVPLNAEVVRHSNTTGLAKQFYRFLGATENTGVGIGPSNDDLEIFIRSISKFRISNGGNFGGSSIFEVTANGVSIAKSGPPIASAALEVNSTTRAVYISRMTQIQRNAISSIENGAMIFCTDCTANDGSTGVTQTYSSGQWRNHY